VVLSSKQWRAAKLAPKKYGNHTTVDTNTAVAVAQTSRLDISTLSDEGLARVLRPNGGFGAQPEALHAD